MTGPSFGPRAGRSPTPDRRPVTRRALIVEDGFRRGSLAACRARGRAGWEIGIGSPERGFASSSRHTVAWHETPPPEEDEAGFVAAVRRAIGAGGYELVFGAGDGE